ncbi:tam-1 [Pristionchus pacificus]|uniref:Tam-1 n=1 Tax=Pristionchus pacificus TaxID=54126 RepID=A0A2A6CRH6_PRIPA|nr:tam-1 [Pristionchus pacificus]|eukprot:PDM80805.1 tam-1 [Pristionchus pacificus]
MRPENGAFGQLFDMFIGNRGQEEDNQEIRLGNNDRGGGGGGMPPMHMMDPRINGGGNGGPVGAPQQHPVQNQMDVHNRMMMGMMGIGGQPAVPGPRMGMGGYMMHPMGPIQMAAHPHHMNGGPPAGPPLPARQQIQRHVRIEQHAYIHGIRHMQQPQMQQAIAPRVAYGYGGRQETVNCPECRSPTTIPPNGLPVNYKVQDLIERVKARSKVIAPVGCICQSCNTPINCPFYFSCNNDECKETAAVICSMCGLRNHNGHNVVENFVLTPEKVNEERVKIKRMMENADLCKSKFFDYRDQILEQTVHVQDVLAQSLNEYEMLDLELDRPEPFTQRDVDLRVHKARKLTKAFEKLVNQMEMTKNSVIETVAKEVDALMVRVNEISKMNTMVDEPDSPPQETERIEREENEEGGGDIYRLNEISLQTTAKVNAYKAQKSMSLQKKREESKKLKSMKQEKRDEMEEERAQPVRRMGMGDIKEEPLDQYVFNLNQIDLRDEDGETRGASSRYTHRLMKRRRLSPSTVASSSSNRPRERRLEDEPCSSRAMNDISVHASIHGPLPFSPQSHLAPPPVPLNTPLPVPQMGNPVDRREMGDLIDGGVVDGILNNEDVIDILDDGRIIRQEDIEGIGEDGRYVVRRPRGVMMMADGDVDDEGEIEY